jgi:hypothetical protein
LLLGPFERVALSSTYDCGEFSSHVEASTTTLVSIAYQRLKGDIDFTSRSKGYKVG